MSAKKMGILIGGLVVLMIIFSCFFTVMQGNEGLVFRLGKIVTDDGVAAQMPGLHMKLPVIDRVMVFDTRLQTFDVKSSTFRTSEQKSLVVDYFAQWRINDLSLYYQRTGGDPARAETLLDPYLDEGLRAEFGRLTLNQVVSDSRASVMARLTERANFNAQKLGITVVDVRIKKIDLPENVMESVYHRMRADRVKAAANYRSRGKASAVAIRAKADEEATVTVATAQSQGNKVRAKGDSVAAKVYADAYSKDPSFYAFFRSLVAYDTSFSSKNDVVLLTPDSQFFHYFNSAGKNLKTHQNNTRHHSAPPYAG